MSDPSMEDKVIGLRSRVERLERQMEGVLLALDPANHSPRNASIDPDTGEVVEQEPGLVPRGKYAGRKHEDVVKADPHHVVWLFNNGKEAGLGYKLTHVEAATELAKTTPEQKRGYTRR